MDERNYKSSLAAGKISLNINKYINKYITRDEIKNLLLFMCPKKKKKKKKTGGKQGDAGILITKIDLVHH